MMKMLLIQYKPETPTMDERDRPRSKTRVGQVQTELLLPRNSPEDETQLWSSDNEVGCTPPVLRAGQVRGSFKRIHGEINLNYISPSPSHNQFSSIEDVKDDDMTKIQDGSLVHRLKMRTDRTKRTKENKESGRAFSSSKSQNHQTRRKLDEVEFNREPTQYSEEY